MTDVDAWDEDGHQRWKDDIAQGYINPDGSQRDPDPPEDWDGEGTWWRYAGPGAEECEWPPPPPCRPLWRLPRWTREGWRAGTPGGCETYLCRTPLRAWRAHRFNHEAPF